MIKRCLARLSLLAIATLLTACASLELSAPRLDEEANKTLQVFSEQVEDAELFLRQASGYLVFPRVIKAGFGVGAETGEGVLRVGGQTVDYYRTTSGSIGMWPSRC